MLVEVCQAKGKRYHLEILILRIVWELHQKKKKKAKYLKPETSFFPFH